MPKLPTHLKKKKAKSEIVIGGSSNINKSKQSHVILIIAVLIFALIGVYILIPSHAASCLTADFDNSPSVGSSDLTILQNNWGKTSATSSTGDANGDGAVNVYDLSILASEWGETTASCPAAPTVTISASPTNINSGDSSTLSWSSTNATSCTASGAWTGTKSTSGSASTGALTSSSTFTLSCTGSAGTGSASTTVDVTSSGSSSYAPSTAVIPPVADAATPNPSTTGVNVTSYGVSTSNSASQNTTDLLTAINDNAGKAVYLPAGTYMVSNFTFPQGTTMDGASNSSWLEGQIYLSANDTLSYMKLGEVGYSTQPTSSAPANNVKLDYIDFVGGGAPGSVFNIATGETLTNSTFTDCTIETDVNDGQNSSGVYNGISVTENGVPDSTAYNDTFLRLHIMTQPRMGLEFNGRAYDGTRQRDYYNINITDSTIEPVGAEDISFDGPGTGITVSGTLLKGSTTATLYSWHEGLEFNGTFDSTASGDTFYADQDQFLNVNCVTGTVCGDVITNNVFDSTINIDGVTMDSEAQAWGESMNGGTFSDNFVRMSMGSGMMYWQNSTNNTFTGNLFWDTRTNNGQCMYFQSGSTGNTMTGNTFKDSNNGGDTPSTCVDSTSSLNFSNNTYEPL